MPRDTIDVRVTGPNALRAEYEGHDVRASGDYGVGYLANDVGGESVGSIFGAGFSKQLPRAATVDVRAVNNNVRNSPLIGQNSVK